MWRQIRSPKSPTLMESRPKTRQGQKHLQSQPMQTKMGKTVTEKLRMRIRPGKAELAKKAGNPGGAAVPRENRYPMNQRKNRSASRASGSVIRRISRTESAMMWMI